MRGYVDGFVLAVPKKKMQAYKRLAQKTAKLWRKHGALDYVEAVGNDLSPKFPSVRFPRIVKAKPSETVVFSYIVFKNRKHRDLVNARVMKDPFMKDPQNQPAQMPFDTKRVVYGGFRVLVEA
jgi:uncharacterized protein YbaA (DUF1428 family)